MDDVLSQIKDTVTSGSPTLCGITISSCVTVGVQYTVPWLLQTANFACNLYLSGLDCEEGLIKTSSLDATTSADTPCGVLSNDDDLKRYLKIHRCGCWIPLPVLLVAMWIGATPSVNFDWWLSSPSYHLFPLCSQSLSSSRLLQDKALCLNASRSSILMVSTPAKLTIMDFSTCSSCADVISLNLRCFIMSFVPAGILAASIWKKNTKLWKLFEEFITQINLRGYCTSYQKLAYFVIYLKIITNFLKNILCIL